MLRWVVCPVVVDTSVDADWVGPPDPVRKPKLAGLIDPSTGREYAWSAAIDTLDWCVVAVYGGDFTPLNADATIIHLLEIDLTDGDDARHFQTVRDLNFNTARLNRIKNRLQARGVDTTGITLDTYLVDILRRIVQVVHPSFEPIGLRAKL